MSLAVAALATLVGGGTYAYAKSKKASNGTAAAAGVAGGAGAAVTAAIVGALAPFLVILGIIGVPAAGVYLYFNKNKRKALGPAPEDY